MDFFNESKFNMWRGCVAAIWADGKVSPEEKKWAEDKINSLMFTPEQKQILTHELETQVDFSDIVAKITDKKDRAFLAHQLRVISHLDKDFSDEEKKLLKSWTEIVLNNVDLSLMNQIIAEDEKQSYHEDEVFKLDNRSSLFEKAWRRTQKLYNLGEWKIPKK